MNPATLCRSSPSDPLSAAEPLPSVGGTGVIQEDGAQSRAVSFPFSTYAFVRAYCSQACEEAVGLNKIEPISALKDQFLENTATELKRIQRPEETHSAPGGAFWLMEKGGRSVQSQEQGKTRGRGRGLWASRKGPRRRCLCECRSSVRMGRERAGAMPLLPEAGPSRPWGRTDLAWQEQALSPGCG